MMRLGTVWISTICATEYVLYPPELGTDYGDSEAQPTLRATVVRYLSPLRFDAVML